MPLSCRYMKMTLLTFTKVNSFIYPQNARRHQPKRIPISEVDKSFKSPTLKSKNNLLYDCIMTEKLILIFQCKHLPCKQCFGGFNTTSLIVSKTMNSHCFTSTHYVLVLIFDPLYLPSVRFEAF